MQRPTMENMAGMAEEKALLWHFNYQNFRRFRRWFLFLGLIAVFSLGLRLISHGIQIADIGFTDFLYEEGVRVLFNRGFELVNIIAVLWFIWIEDRKLADKYGYQTLLTMLFLQYGVIYFNTDLSNHIAVVTYLLFILPWLRLKSSDFFLLYGSLILTTLVLGPLEGSDEMRAAVYPVIGGVSLAFALGLTSRKRIKFLKEFRKERGKVLEKRRFYQELDAAKRIQLSMLPAEPPHCAVLDVAGACYPASEVGGDYYDFLETQAGHSAIVTGDVSGHGLASGLVLSSVRGGLYVSEEMWDQPDELLTHLNWMLKRTTEKQVFMTLVYLVFDLKQRQLKLANAGHQPVMHYRAATQDVVELRFPALPLGGVKNATYPVHQLTFSPGDVFLVYTDGLNEAFSPKGEDFGIERVQRKFHKQAKRGSSAREICDALWHEVKGFMKDELQADDITLVAIRAR